MLQEMRSAAVVALPQFADARICATNRIGAVARPAEATNRTPIAMEGEAGQVSEAVQAMPAAAAA